MHQTWSERYLLQSAISFSPMDVVAAGRRAGLALDPEAVALCRSCIPAALDDRGNTAAQDEEARKLEKPHITLDRARQLAGRLFGLQAC